MFSFTFGFIEGALIAGAGCFVGYLISAHFFKDKINNLVSLTSLLKSEIFSKNVLMDNLIKDKNINCEKVKIPFYVAKFIKYYKKNDSDISTILSDVFGSSIYHFDLTKDEGVSYFDVKKWLELPNNAEKFVKAILYDNYEVEDD